MRIHKMIVGMMMVFYTKGASVFEQIAISKYSNITPIRVGCSTSAYQIEGAWNESGRSPSIWDEFVHRLPSPIVDHSNGDRACDSYHFVKHDLDLLESLGVKDYRFSLSWSRLFPEKTDPDAVNPLAVTFYRTLLESMARRSIQPWITLFHWDLPLYLQTEYGGWESREIITSFRVYANFCFETFDEFEPYWITINEPKTFCQLGYGSGAHAPGFQKDPFLIGHHMLLAHAEAYITFHDHPRRAKGVSLSLNSDYYYPKDPSKEADRLASEYTLQYEMGWFADPVLLGDYPEILQSKTPRFSIEESRRIYHSLDFIAINHYSAFQVSSPSDTNPFTQGNIGTSSIHWEPKTGARPTASSWLFVYPESIQELLLWIDQRYDLSEWPVAITEHGISVQPDVMDDAIRRDMLPQVYEHLLYVKATKGINVTTYLIWSLLDNFEWAAGYTERFGLFAVDFQASDLKRTPRLSVQSLF